MSETNFAEMLELEPPEIAEKLKTMEAPEAARLFAALIEEEQRLSLLNLLKPYKDKVPLVLQDLEVAEVVRFFNHLNDYYIMRALFGNFRVVEEHTRQQILEELESGKVAALLHRMSKGVDNPKTAAKMLRKLQPRTAVQAVEKMEPPAIARILAEAEMGEAEKAGLLGGVSPAKAAKIVEAMLGPDNIVRTAVVAAVLRHMPGEKREEIMACLPAPVRAAVQGQITRRYDSDLERISLKEAKGRLGDMELVEVANRLLTVNPARRAELLDASGPQRAAEILTLWAQDDPDSVADLLAAINTKITVDYKKKEGVLQPVEEMYMCPAASILEEIDLSRPGNVAALRKMERADLEMILERTSEEKRAEISAHLEDQALEVELPVSWQMFASGRGERRTTKLDYGMKWTRIEERLDTGLKEKPVVIDLVEIDPSRVIIKARRSVTDENVTPITEVARIFGDAKRSGTRPDRKIFSQLGLIQLSRVVAETGAIAGINGNHYYDYGHYMDVIKLGIDPTGVPGLFFGDPIGWFVIDGLEVSPPAFNRAAFIVTKDGRVFIQRVFMTDLTFSNGVKVVWDGMNVPKERGKIILYNNLFGFRTPPGDTHVDIASAKNKIWQISEGGDTMIPFTGFVLSIPVEQRDTILKGVKLEDSVTVGNNFPAHLGEVEQAMASGPHLISDGQIDISFQAEDFGEKDSSVMSFSLTRAVETFEAARSFMALKGNKIIIGTVSGTALGTGLDTASAGMTFGELAQLCDDLRVDHAYALDGGGSSSIVVPVEGEATVLNIPTGGSDVARGEERFINTYWLFFPRGN
jgi:Mg/Co/Ni transporter MgtE